MCEKYKAEPGLCRVDEPDLSPILFNSKNKMMKIAIIGATGKEGTCLMNEALRRGHDVTAIVRDRRRLAAVEGLSGVVEKDLFKLQRADLLGFDAVLDAFGTWEPETLFLHEKSVRHLGELLAGTGIRLLVVGGAGSLYVDETRTLMLADSPDFPEAFRPLARACREAYRALASCSDVVWTYLCPPADFDPAGERTGAYRAGSDVLLTNDNNESSMSYADYAIAMIDEVEDGAHLRQLFTVANA